MIPSGHYVMLSDADHEHYQVLRIESRLTRRLYLATVCCGEHGEPCGAGMIVVDVKVMAERHPEWGPRGVVFTTHAELREYLDLGDADAVSPPAPSAVH